MNHVRRIMRDQAGATVVELALTFPTFIIFVWSICQIGMVMAADAGMQHALGEGARMTTLYPTPSDTAIKAKISGEVFGTYIGTYDVSDPTTHSDTVIVTPAVGATPAVTRTIPKYKDLRVQYTVTPNLLFYTAPAVTFTRTKRVYLVF